MIDRKPRMSPAFAGWTLDQARAWIRQQADNGGASCPCCDQFAKVYARPMSSTMGYGLILISRYFLANPAEEWLHIPSFFTQRKACSSNDGALLRHWGLLDQRVGERDDGSKRIGFYKITELGRRFVRAEVRVPKRAILYDGKLIQLDESEMVDIRDVLGTRFNYAELMQPVGDVR